MFSSFMRSAPQLTIFHHASSPPSTTALALLKAALSGPYPASNSSAKPLNFNLEVVEASPTPDQLTSILSYIKKNPSGSPISTYISSHPTSPDASAQPQTPEAVAELAQKTPTAFKWPVIVDWSGGRASIEEGESGVKSILEEIRKRRDGEVKDEESHDPKGWFS